VSGRAGAKAGGSKLVCSLREKTRIPSRVVTGKSILVFGKAARFAVRRRNAGLDRSGSRSGYLPAAGVDADDSGCSKVAEEGNVVGMRHQAHAPVTGTRDRRRCSRDASFARSFGPCTLILTMLRGESSGGEAFEGASRSGKPVKAGRTGTGVFTNGRCAARRGPPLSQGRKRGSSEEEGDRGLRPREDRQSPGLVARTS